jgi:ATP-dependent DNA helicase RecG
MGRRLTSSEIESLLQSGEGYNVEFKISIPKKVRELTEEVCAFANSTGGVIFIGVSDDNIVHGIEISNSKKSAIQNSIDEINPHLNIDFYSVDIDEKRVWVIEVDSGKQKPYIFSGAIYTRQGPNTQKLTSVEQMRDFFQQSERIYFDETPCHDFNLEHDFDYDWFEEFRVEAKLTSFVSQDQIISNLRLLLENHKMKNGGVLFFGKSPDKYIETAKIRCTAFKGTNKTRIIDDKIFKGPLFQQYKQVILWLRGKLNVKYEIEGSGPRKEIWEIPQTVFKEAIINALSHRDYYDKGAIITIEIFDNRIEISNLGGLTTAIAQSEFGTKSHSRNPLVFGLFEKINMVEKIGSGISRIRDSMENAKLQEPVFKTEGFFTVILFRETVEETVEEISRRNK